LKRAVNTGTGDLLVAFSLGTRVRSMTEAESPRQQAERLRQQADRCIRLANSTVDRGVVYSLMELAAEYQQRALTIEKSLGGP